VSVKTARRLGLARSKPYFDLSNDRPDVTVSAAVKYGYLRHQPPKGASHMS